MAGGATRRLGIGMSMSLAGTIAYAAAQWLALVMLAHWTSAEAVGQYALALAICGPVILFTNLQLANLQSTDGQGAFTFPQYFALRLLMTTLAFTVIITASLLWFDAVTARIVALLAVGKCIEAISDAVHGTLMRRGRFLALSQALTVNALTSLAGFGIAAYLTRDVTVAVIGWAAGSMVTVLALNLRTAVRLHTTARWPSAEAIAFLTAGLRQREALLRLVRLAWPMGVISTLLSLQANAPQYVIQHLLGASAVGTFAILAYPFLAGNIAVTAMGQAAAPQFAEALGNEDAGGFRRVLFLTMASGAALGLAAVVMTWLGGAQFIEFFYSSAYVEHQGLFFVLACAAGVRYAYLPIGVAATAQRRIGVQLWLRMATLVVVTAAIAAGAQSHGLSGAALAFLCVSVAEGLVWVAIALGSLRDARLLSPAVAAPVSWARMARLRGSGAGHGAPASDRAGA